MNMNAILKTTLGLVIGLGGFAAPGNCSAIFSFVHGGGANGGANGTYDSVSGIGALDTNTLIANINGTSTTYTFTTGFFHLTFNTIADTLQIAVSAPSGVVETVGGNTNSTFTTANLANGLTLLSNTTNLNENITAVNPQVISNVNTNSTTQFASAFLTDLGLGSLIGSTFAISTASFSSPFNSPGVISSNTLVFTSVPEPSTVILFAAGLIALVAFSRKHKPSRV